MLTLEKLTGADRRTYQKISHPPHAPQTAAPVRRTAVRSLLETLGQVSEGEGKCLEITRNGHVLLLPSLGVKKTESKDGLIALRHFLARSENPLNRSNGRDPHLLLVIGHHEARLFCSEINGGCPKQVQTSDAEHGFPLAPSSNSESSADANASDCNAVFEPIAQALRDTGKILIFGESSATQSEMNRFIVWLKREHPAKAERIIGSLVIKISQAHPDMLWTESREFYSRTRPPARGAYSAMATYA